MAVIALGATDLARVRFGFNAAWETIASVHAAQAPEAGYLHRPLVQRLRRPDPDTADLIELLHVPGWIPDAVAPVPSPRPRDPQEDFAALLETAPETAGADLEELRRWLPRSSWARVSGPDEYLERLSGTLDRYWHRHLAARWESVEATVAADVARRLPALGAEGVASALNELGSAISFDAATSRLTFSLGSCTHEAAGHGLWLVPSVFRWPGVAVAARAGEPPVIAFAAVGFAAIWETEPHDGRGIADLVGRSRAQVLAAVTTPRSTTELARSLELAPATVSSHLSTLAATGLVESRREGRVVLYTRTRLGEALLVGGGRERLLA